MNNNKFNIGDILISYYEDETSDIPNIWIVSNIILDSKRGNENYYSLIGLRRDKKEYYRSRYVDEYYRKLNE